MIDHVPSGWMSTSLETISMSFASSPMRFESTARMLGSIPLEIPRYQREGRHPRVTGGRGVPGDDDHRDVLSLAVFVEFLEAGIEYDVYATKDQS